MIFDVHGHVGPWFFVMDPGAAPRNRALNQQCGITVQVVSDSLAVTYDFQAGNRRLAGALADAPDLFGYVTLNPNYPAECAAELERWAGRPEFVGVKIHPVYTHSGLASRQMRQLWSLLADYPLPVLVHTWGPEVADLPAILERHPSLRVIAAHMGGPQWREAIAVAADCPGLYLEPSGSVIDRGKVELAAARLPDRLLFGTDATLAHPAWALGMIADAGLPDEVRHHVLWDNAVQLFNVDGPRTPTGQAPGSGLPHS